MTGPSGAQTAAEAAESLRALLAAIERGEVEASAEQRAYLAGAVDTLAALAGPSDDHSDHPKLR